MGCFLNSSWLLIFSAQRWLLIYIKPKAVGFPTSHRGAFSAEILPSGFNGLTAKVGISVRSSSLSNSDRDSSDEIETDLHFSRDGNHRHCIE
jgi:hypothetical protein